MKRYVDNGLSSLELLKPEIWVCCPKCEHLAKIKETTIASTQKIEVICTYCSYRKKLEHYRSISYDFVNYYFNLNSNIEEWAGACKIAINKKCLNCKEGKYKFEKDYTRKSIIPRYINVECNFCIKIQAFDHSQFEITKLMANKIGADPYYHFPLYLTTPVRQGLICAFNPQHLQILKNYIQADLRERKYPNYNKSYFSRLPDWIKSARNRKEIVKALLRLEQMATTIQPSTNK